MPIVTSDVLLKYSVKTGSSGNATSGTASGSLGKYISTSQWSGGSINDLFDNVTAVQNAASQVDYRCIFVHNNHASLTILSPVVWFLSKTYGGVSMAVAVDTTAASAIGDSSAQAVDIANATTTPVGLTFVAHTVAKYKSAGVSLGDIPAGYCKAIWLRRTASNSGVKAADGFTLRLEGDTQP